MLRFVVYFFLISVLFIGFGFSFLNNFEKQKEQILTKYQLETKTTSLFIKENLKKYLQNKDIEILNTINSVFNNNFSSISIQKALFSIKEKELIDLTNNLDKTLSWEISNIKIDDNLGQIILSTQSDDLQKELLTIEGSIPNEINKNITPSSDIYTFVPSKNFRNLSTLVINFDATNQFDETKTSSTLISFEKDISSFTNNQNENIAPLWFKQLVPIYFNEEESKVNNSLQNDAIFYLNTNIEKIYFELYKEAKTEFLNYFFWFFISFISVLFIDILYRVIKSKS
ncbi:hypothetical protein CJ671_07165 [Aliarcobacter cryaerophilus]|uniref:LapD/MoxY periplasmic domain-containing protein n=1 Tax=Aliarcobacter cryaerophilus TaxID=28198 RepID=A0A2S9SSG6_9BACT|nr:hypothetical protein [Aliarcobacter cryaerophilus]PRM89516.1 hypothetical protein CJ671_07165 [Aliarcobacter cryaerophilus]